ncbi:MAG: hypothetical protein R3C49_00805 [Planctomycetaceae bacterium]
MITFGLVTCAGAVFFLPGCGLRTLAVHLMHWNDANYNSPRFARELREIIPKDDVCAVDTQLVLDFVVAGRPTLLACTAPQYFRLQDTEFDTLIVSRYGLDNRIAESLNVQLTETRGVRDDPWACYAELYRFKGSPPITDSFPHDERVETQHSD